MESGLCVFLVQNTESDETMKWLPFLFFAHPKSGFMVCPFDSVRKPVPSSGSSQLHVAQALVRHSGLRLTPRALRKVMQGVPWEYTGNPGWSTVQAELAEPTEAPRGSER